MTQDTLTFISTSLIVGSGVSLLAGVALIRWRKAVDWHKRAMLTATVLAALFLVAYVTRWSMYGSKPFAGEGMWRGLYLGLLVPHIILATAVGPMALRLIYLALGKRDYASHKKLARVVVPMWLFVALSGWTIYGMLYRWFA